jgi:hypothetical protein
MFFHTNPYASFSSSFDNVDMKITHGHVYKMNSFLFCKNSPNIPNPSGPRDLMAHIDGKNSRSNNLGQRNELHRISQDHIICSDGTQLHRMCQAPISLSSIQLQRLLYKLSLSSETLATEHLQAAFTLLLTGG